MSISSCRTSSTLYVDPQIGTQRDTLQTVRVQYDSIYIDNWQFIDHRADTVYVEKKVREYKYKILHDTLRFVRVDSIPVIREVYHPPRQGDRGGPSLWQLPQTLAWLGILFIVYLVLRILGPLTGRS